MVFPDLVAQGGKGFAQACDSTHSHISMISLLLLTMSLGSSIRDRILL